MATPMQNCESQEKKSQMQMCSVKMRDNSNGIDMCRGLDKFVEIPFLVYRGTENLSVKLFSVAHPEFRKYVKI